MKIEKNKERGRESKKSQQVEDDEILDIKLIAQKYSQGFDPLNKINRGNLRR